MKLVSINKGLQKGLRKNKKGGIEGLPLQLMIIIIVATLSTGILVGWMNNIDTPNSIGDVSIDSGEACLGDSAGSGFRYIDEEICVTVCDQNGNPLEGAAVVLTGLGIKTESGNVAYGITDENGNATFSDLMVKMNGPVGFVDVNVSKAGYGEDGSCKITIIA